MHKQSNSYKQSNEYKQYLLWSKLLCLSGMGHLCFFFLFFFLYQQPAVAVNVLVKARAFPAGTVLMASKSNGTINGMNGAVNRLKKGGKPDKTGSTGTREKVAVVDKKTKKIVSATVKKEPEKKLALHKKSVQKVLDTKSLSLDSKSQKLSDKKSASHEESASKKLDKKSASQEKTTQKAVDKKSASPDKSIKKAESTKLVSQEKNVQKTLEKASQKEQDQKKKEPVADLQKKKEQMMEQARVLDIKKQEQAGVKGADHSLPALQEEKKLLYDTDMQQNMYAQHKDVTAAHDQAITIGVGDVCDAQALARYQLLREELSRMWQPPIGVVTNGCTVQVVVDKCGKTNTFEVTQGSGVLMFDISVQSVCHVTQWPRWAHNKVLSITFV